MAWQGPPTSRGERRDAYTADSLARAALAEAVLADLDRCEHGRHEGDVCSGCGGPSAGNPFMSGAFLDRRDQMPYVPRQIGFDLSGNPIVVPADRKVRHHPEAWRTVQP